MLKAVSEDIGLGTESDQGPIGSAGCPVCPDVPAAASLKNVLFFLSLVFRYPRGAVYAEIRRLLPVFGDFFDAYAGAAPGLPEEEALQSEYIRLFVNNRGSLPAVPYAACYLDGGILIGESYHKLRQIMGKTGFVLDESAGELEDHLTILLEYASMLTGRLIDGAVSGKAVPEDIRASLDVVIFQYLQPMTEPILSGILDCASSDFYVMSARALFNFMADAEAIYSQVFGVSVLEALKTGVEK